MSEAVKNKARVGDVIKVGDDVEVIRPDGSVHRVSDAYVLDTSGVHVVDGTSHEVA